jgi:pimeloyl-ACP methyl ester carboxylesterase
LNLITTALWTIASLVGTCFVLLATRGLIIIQRYGPSIRRIFEEDPIFVPPESLPHPAAEEVEFQTPQGLKLRGSYLEATSSKPKGIVVFCHEFRADRWSGVSYWDFLHRDGFDIFSFDFRSHGDSDKDPSYKPRHWVTNNELSDMRAAIGYLKSRPQAEKKPIGLLGISRGGGAAIAAAAGDRSVRCVLTDGAFPTHGTMLAYMKKWLTLVVGDKWWGRLLPDWYLRIVRDVVLARVERDIGCRFTRLERAIRRLAPRPLLMIHGGRDSYIRPDIARMFFENAREPRELWIVKGARHNACLDTAGDEYRRRTIDFFNAHLAEPPSVTTPSESLQPQP